MLNLTHDELMRYTSVERTKWRRFFADHPEAVAVPLQPSGALATVGKLIVHIFLAERRHLQRLRGEALSTATGLTANNATPLFDYGASVRRELEQFAADVDEDVANQVRTFEVRDDDTWLRRVRWRDAVGCDRRPRSRSTQPVPIARARAAPLRISA